MLKFFHILLNLRRNFSRQEAALDPSFNKNPGNECSYSVRGSSN